MKVRRTELYDAFAVTAGTPPQGWTMAHVWSHDRARTLMVCRGDKFCELHARRARWLDYIVYDADGDDWHVYTSDDFHRLFTIESE